MLDVVQKQVKDDTDLSWNGRCLYWSKTWLDVICVWKIAENGNVDFSLLIEKSLKWFEF